MQSLRDKLLKSGLVDKKEARQAKTESRRERKQRGGARATAVEAEQRKQDNADREAAEARAARDEAARVNEERARREHAERLRQIIERHRVLKVFGEERRFFFVRADRHIHRLDTTHEIRDRLVSGELAIVAAPYDQDRGYRVVERAVAERLEALDAAYLLFWNKLPDDADRPTYGATGPQAAPVAAAT
jgi:hypothetical protein